MSSRWQSEKSQLMSVQKLKEQMEEAQRNRDIAQRKGDLTKAGEIVYSIIPKLQEQLREAEKLTQNAMMKEAVTDEDIAAIVSRWTGIPVEKMLEGEREKLLHMEDALHSRVVGQDEALAAVSNAVRRARAGLAGSGAPHRLVFIFGPDRRRQDRTYARRWPNLFLMTKRRCCASTCRNIWKNMRWRG